MEHVLYLLAAERFFQHDKLVQNDAYRPHISLAIIRLTKADFGRHEVGGAAASHSFSILCIELSRNAKVAQLANAIFSNKDVLRFYVTVEDIFIVHRHDCHDDVGKCPQDLIGRELCA